MKTYYSCRLSVYLPFPATTRVVANAAILAAEKSGLKNDNAPGLVNKLLKIVPEYDFRKHPLEIINRNYDTVDVSGEVPSNRGWFASNNPFFITVYIPVPEVPVSLSRVDMIDNVFLDIFSPSVPAVKLTEILDNYTRAFETSLQEQAKN